VTRITVGGKRLELTNLDKVLWPKAGFTKGQLIEYYVDLAPVLLPHLDGRPLTVRRFPDGVDGVSWHQNECRRQPPWFPVFETTGRGGRQLRFCMVDGEASLVWLANQAAIELHPFTWRIDAPRVATQLVFDLDPGPPADLVTAARVALALRDLLDELGLEACVKSSGSLGLHVHVPLGSPLESPKQFARDVARALAVRSPHDVVAEMRKDLRAGKVYVDWLQNDPTRQTVAPYSLRGSPWPTVAAPLTWDEVEYAAASQRGELLLVTASDIGARLERHGDLFATFAQ
jgi:bifunctional non-homologous end joining protein LigD